MSLGLLGNKIGMTQIFDESGNIIPVTVLKIGPCVITQVKTILTDGYNAIQIGYGNVSTKYLTQPELGHLQKSNIQPLKYLKEFKIGKVIFSRCKMMQNLNYGRRKSFKANIILNRLEYMPDELINFWWLQNFLY